MRRIKRTNCLYCEKDFLRLHGNKKFCSETCAYAAKLDRQTEQYEIGDRAKKAIQKNHKLFTELLGGDKSGEFDLTELIIQGFNRFGFFNFSNEKNIVSYQLEEFIYQFTNTTPTKLKIWK
jgi:hypothetical protein